ncbi:RBP11-like subunits of RNA polymerase [Xylariaceae sp. FL0662B]|nr:RBP11-like subunits of RNA polymerase [Xylariaceae sp. FL0662B]
MSGRTKSRGGAPVAVKSEDITMDDAPPSAQKPAQSQEDDEPMQEDQTGGGEDYEEDEEDEEEEEEEEESQRVRILPGSSETAASFEFLKEDYGMSTHYYFSPDVEFCAYAIPHPSEDKMNLRIQTYDTTTAAAALAKGLQDLEDLCDVVAEEFWSERDKFNASPEQILKREEDDDRRRQALGIYPE